MRKIHLQRDDVKMHFKEGYIGGCAPFMAANIMRSLGLAKGPVTESEWSNMHSEMHINNLGVSGPMNIVNDYFRNKGLSVQMYPMGNSKTIKTLKQILDGHSYTSAYILIAGDPAIYGNNHVEQITGITYNRKEKKFTIHTNSWGLKGTLTINKNFDHYDTMTTVPVKGDNIQFYIGLISGGLDV